MSEELMAKLGDLITDVVAVRSCTSPDKTLWTKAQVMHYLQIGETRLAQKLNVLQLARMVGHRDIRSLQTCYNETAESMARLL